MLFHRVLRLYIRRIYFKYTAWFHPPRLLIAITRRLTAHIIIGVATLSLGYYMSPKEYFAGSVMYYSNTNRPALSITHHISWGISIYWQGNAILKTWHLHEKREGRSVWGRRHALFRLDGREVSRLTIKIASHFVAIKPHSFHIPHNIRTWRLCTAHCALIYFKTTFRIKLISN